MELDEFLHQKHAEIGSDNVRDGSFFLLGHRKNKGIKHQKCDKLGQVFKKELSMHNPVCSCVKLKSSSY